MSIISRVGFCTECAKAGRPKTDQVYLVHGSSGNCFHVKRANWIGNIGYVPHTYRLIKSLGENVIVKRACGMFECGVDVKTDHRGRWYFHPDSSWERVVMSLADWNALVLYKHDPNYEI